MILAFFDEYLEFFIILFTIILIMILVYFIFFRPRPEKKSFDSPDDIKDTEDLKKNDYLDLESDYVLNKDDYVLGQNSNLLESISSDGEVEVIVGQNVTKEPGSFGYLDSNIEEEPTTVTKSKKEKSKIKNDFNVVDDIIKKQFKFSSNPDGFYEQEPPKVEINAEEEISRIVQTVIPREDIPADFGKYHVSHKKENQKWYVKREGEEKPERELVTKTEAIAYATIKALEYNTSIVVHDKDGKISKYTF